MSGHCTSYSVTLGVMNPQSLSRWDSHYPGRYYYYCIYYNYLIYNVGIPTTQASPETILSLSLVLVQWPRLPSVALTEDRDSSDDFTRFSSYTPLVNQSHIHSQQN